MRTGGPCNRASGILTAFSLDPAFSGLSQKTGGVRGATQQNGAVLHNPRAERIRQYRAVSCVVRRIPLIRLQSN